MVNYYISSPPPPIPLVFFVLFFLGYFIITELMFIAKCVKWLSLAFLFVCVMIAFCLVKGFLCKEVFVVSFWGAELKWKPKQ